MSRLIACTSCRRHARASETSCPFCGAVMPAIAPARGRPAGKLGRAALVVAATTGVAAATDLTGCSDGPTVVAGDAYGLAADVFEPDHVVAADAYGLAFDARPEADADDAADASDATDAPTDDASDGSSD